jgi:hypothetical protein
MPQVKYGLSELTNSYIQQLKIIQQDHKERV